MKHILAAVEFARKRERRLTNNNSLTTAQLAQIVAIYASHGQSKLEPYRLLPFPEEVEMQQKGGGPRISAAVAASIRRCIRDRTLPLDVLVLLKGDLDRAAVV